MVIGTHLESSYRMLREAYQNGISDADYYPLVALLYEDFSDRNLAEVISCFTGKEYSVVINDIANSQNEMSPHPEEVIRIRNKLERHGYSEWKLEE
ncbi:hypothetical protein A9Q81_20360 [Gammaproteobacteria bacterium 42_54_T18]|nr:hypothetical protein A9Q81_20360 [Gammaproteobacteria bacterium 42_54_T18]